MQRYVWGGLSLFLVFMIQCSTVSADINQSNTRGLIHILKPKYAHYSPMYGLAFLRSLVLKNIRFNGNFGPENPNYKCHNQLKADQKKQDCPQDSVAVLVQQFFPSPAGGHLHPNNTPDLIGKLNFKAMGTILRVLDNQQNYGKDLPMHLAIEIFKSQDPNSFKDFHTKATTEKQGPVAHDKQLERAEINKLKKDLGEQIKKLTLRLKDKNIVESERTKLINQKEALQKRARDLATPAKEGEQSSSDQQSYNAVYELLKKEGVDETRKENFFTPYMDLANTIIQAMEGVKAYPNAYPDQIIEKTIVAFVWKKAKSKDDFLKYFEGLGLDKLKDEYVQEHSITPPAEWKTPFTQEDYDAFKGYFVNGKPTAELFQKILQDPEAILFYTLAYDVYESPYPPILQTGSVITDIVVNGEKRSVHYQDCGETTVRNFLNLLFFNKETRTFDLDFIKAIAPNADPKLMTFYEGQTLESMEEKRNDWGNIVFQIPGVSYLKGGKAEIATGLSNVLKVIVHLFQDDQLNQINQSDESTLVKSAKILERICEMVNQGRPGFNLDWLDMLDGKMISGESEAPINILIGGKEMFRWEIMPGHFGFVEISKTTTDDWRKSMDDQILSLIFEAQTPDHSALSSVLAPFYLLSIDGKAKVDTLSESVRQSLYPLIIYSFNLGDMDGVKNAASFFLGFPKTTQEMQKITPLHLIVANRWMPTFSKNASIAVSLLNKLALTVQLDENDPSFKILKSSIDKILKENPILLSSIIMNHNNDLFWFLVGFFKDDPAFINTRPDRDNTFLHMAVQSGNIEMIHMLSEKAPQLFEEPLIRTLHAKQNPLHLTASSCKEEMSAYLIENFPQLLKDPLVKDDENYTPLHSAVMNNCMKVVKQLISVAPELVLVKGGETSEVPASFLAMINYYTGLQKYLEEEERKLESSPESQEQAGEVAP